MLRTRVATALVLAALLLGVLFALPHWVAAGCFALVMVQGLVEWTQFARLAGLAARLGYVGAGVALGALAWGYAGDGADCARLMAAAALFWGASFLWLTLAPARVPRLAALLAGPCVLVPAGVGLGRLVLGAGPPSGAAWIVFMVLLVAAADIGAYFAGRAFGRRRLAPRVSPGKTWEGLAGGLLLAAAVAAAGARVLGLPPLPVVMLGLVVALASVVGDLTESMMKRAAGLKDSGRLLPGHGGVLDRIDSITAAVPFYVLGLGWLGVLG
jgi:phosphatidate cytidylyltransferase